MAASVLGLSPLWVPTADPCQHYCWFCPGLACQLNLDPCLRRGLRLRGWESVFSQLPEDPHDPLGPDSVLSVAADPHSPWVQGDQDCVVSLEDTTHGTQLRHYPRVPAGFSED